MYSPFTISENNHIWKQDMDRRSRIHARQLELNPANDLTLRDLERDTLRHRLADALANLVRRPSASRVSPASEVRTATNT
jgi:hypothetical protein